LYRNIIYDLVKNQGQAGVFYKVFCD